MLELCIDSLRRGQLEIAIRELKLFWDDISDDSSMFAVAADEVASTSALDRWHSATTACGFTEHVKRELDAAGDFDSVARVALSIVNEAGWILRNHFDSIECQKRPTCDLHLCNEMADRLAIANRVIDPRQSNTATLRVPAWMSKGNVREFEVEVSVLDSLAKVIEETIPEFLNDIRTSEQSIDQVVDSYARKAMKWGFWHSTATPPVDNIGDALPSDIRRKNPRAMLRILNEVAFPEMSGLNQQESLSALFSYYFEIGAKALCLSHCSILGYPTDQLASEYV